MSGKMLKERFVAQLIATHVIIVYTLRIGRSISHVANEIDLIIAGKSNVII